LVAQYLCVGDINSPDESLSLAGGFLFSGYRGAVATMWSINDNDGAEVAKSFYKYLMKEDGPLAMSAALALHCAVRDLRAANPNIELIRWIPFMYLGVTRGAN
jgi:CHAT domain-containing protein